MEGMNVEDQYMDDLFGETDHVHHISTATPVIKSLALRFDELAFSNCCNKIAWSRFGCIAAVADKGRRVDLRVLVRNPKSGEWILQKPTHVWPPIPQHHQIVHLAWNGMGNDLAVVDSAGRLMIYTTGFTLGSMMLVHTAMGESEDAMNCLAGLYWLPVFPHMQKVHTCWSATRSNDNWSVQNHQFLTAGPSNPIEGKSALVYLTRKGSLRLLYQTKGAATAWSEVAFELDDAAFAAEYSFTHAAFSPAQESALFLAAHQVRRTLRTYHVRINWNMPAKPEPDQQGHVMPKPSLEVRAVSELNCFGPGQVPLYGDANSNGHVELSPHYELSRLLFVPPNPEQGSAGLSSGTLFAIFTIIPQHSSMIFDTAHQYQQTSSIVSRWDLLKESGGNLSACFDQLKVKKNSTNGASPRQSMQLNQLDDVTVSPAIVSAEAIRNDTIFTVVLGNGTVQFRERETFDILLVDDRTDEVRTLPQSGFSFPNLEDYAHTALSPGACMVALLKPDHEVVLAKMQYIHGSIESIEESQATHDSIAAVMALQYSTACLQYKVADDVLAILPQKLSKSMSQTFVSLCARFLSVNFDLMSVDAQKQILSLLRNHLPFRCFSLQNTLGSADRTGPRKLSARLAWITINIRHVAQNIYFNLRSEQNLSAEMAISFVGLIKWSLDLCVYLLQEIFSLYYAIKHEAHEGRPDRAKDRDWLQERIDKQHSPALILLLSSMPRILLRMMFRPLRHGYVHAKNGFGTAQSMEQKTAFHKLLGVYSSTPVNHGTLGPLEELAIDIDNLIKEAYTKASTTSTSDAATAAARSATERNMFLTGRIPTVLMPVVTTILTTKVESLMTKVDPAKVYVHDISWLGLTDDQRTRSFQESHTIDVVRKMPLAAGTRLRVCPRCASVMEDIGQAHAQGGGQQQQPWVWASHKVCICYSSWASFESKD